MKKTESYKTTTPKEAITQIPQLSSDLLRMQIKIVKEAVMFFQTSKSDDFFVATPISVIEEMDRHLETYVFLAEQELANRNKSTPVSEVKKLEIKK